MSTKLQYLLRSSGAEPAPRFTARVLDEVAPRLLEAGPARLKVTLTSRDAPRLSVIPYRRERLALFSIWDEASPQRAAERWTSVVRPLGGGAWSGYRVEESIPLEYERDWQDGTQTPGLGYVTLLRRKPGLQDATFLRRWHEGHSTLALRVHPLWCYVRNVVEGEVVPGSPKLCGIVEEHFRDDRELLSQISFFGGPRNVLPNMVRIGLDVVKWLDLSSIENYLTTERWLRS